MPCDIHCMMMGSVFVFELRVKISLYSYSVTLDTCDVLQEVRMQVAMTICTAITSRHGLLQKAIASLNNSASE